MTIVWDGLLTEEVGVADILVTEQSGDSDLTAGITDANLYLDDVQAQSSNFILSGSSSVIEGTIIVVNKTGWYNLSYNAFGSYIGGVAPIITQSTFSLLNKDTSISIDNSITINNFTEIGSGFSCNRIVYLTKNVEYVLRVSGINAVYNLLLTSLGLSLHLIATSLG
jgi:hypothetical protein